MEALFKSPPAIPGFILGERLGQGSYAVVFKALTAAPGPSGVKETVAIKCIPRARILKSKFSVESLLREISILKKLRHRNIVTLIDFRWDKNYIFLIMEYCPGGDLSSFIRSHTCLPEAVARKFLRQLASAMKYLRAQNISHMDLKPQNLLLTSRYTPVLKIGDFGFAQHLRDYDSETAFKGSPLYMAPEILSRRHYDARVDLWSIGVIVYESVFGRAPFSAPDLAELVTQITSYAPVHIPHASDGVELSSNAWSLLDGLLRKNPNHRLNFEEFFNHPFVDLDHAPSEESWKLALDCADKAGVAESIDRNAEAVKHYVKALDQSMAALQMAESDTERQQMRSKIRVWMGKAERLRAALSRPASAASATPREESLNEVDQLKKDWADTPQIAAAFLVIEKAEKLSKEEKYEEAIAKYKLAVESGLQLLAGEPAGRRRELLKKRVERWLDKAERMQDWWDATRLNLSSLERQEEAVMAVEQKADSLVQQQQCCVQ